MSKHTPGPWKLNENATGEYWLIRPMDQYDEYDPLVRLLRRHEANARLIAAAPELLDACKLALKAFEDRWAIDWGDLERAIAKAEGREP